MMKRSYATMRMCHWLFLVTLLSHTSAVDARWLRNAIKRFMNVGTIVKFRLIDADTNLPIMDIENNQMIVLPLTNATNFNIDAVTDGHVGSIRFSYLGNENFRVESRPPHALCSKAFLTRNYNACPNFEAGRLEITATPYNRVFELGEKGIPVTLSFTVVTDLPISNAPFLAPTTPDAPIMAPATAPQRMPTNSVPSPTAAAPTPRMPPVSAPQRTPTNPTLTNAPRNVPVTAPSSTECAKPKFTDASWQISGPQYPLARFAEPQGLLIGNDMVVISGFTNYFANATNQTFARDVTNNGSSWRRMDDMPMDSGVTHAATLAIGTKVYLCGGYMGGHPGPHVPFCFIYDHSVPPGQQKQWSKLTNLPNGGSAGGGMIYDSASNTLFFSGGGQRRVAGNPHPVDINNTWKYQLSKPGLGWVASTPLPYLANHLSYVTHTDDRGTERHFFMGGQVGENECCSNFASNFEFIASTETWVERASMPIARGHTTSSTRAIGCGFITAGGSIDSGTTMKARTDDISYYDIPSNTWTMGIGTIPKATATPIVDIHSNGYMYFVTGLPNQSRRRISVA